MEFDVLKKILKEKLEILSSNLEQEEQKIEEIEKLQSIIRKIKDDPYILYTSTDDNFINSLGFSSDELSMIDKCKKIYEGFLLFGREAIPQISIVEENTLKIQTDLEKKIYLLSDVAAKHQGTILSYQEYERLGKEVFSDDQYITQVDALINLLNSTDLIEYDKNRIKMAVIDRNNSIYRNLKKSLETKDDVIEEVAVSDTIISEDNVSDNSFQQLIDVITINLENKFGPDALKRIESISDLLKECKVKEEIDALLEGWEYSLGAPFSEIIDAVISVKNIEILELKDAFGADAEEIRDEVDFLNKQISSLNDYKAEISFEKNLDSTEVSVDMNEYEKAIYEYNSDPYASPNCVLFINNSIGRDIDAIKDKETLQDLFLLIEQWKKVLFNRKILFLLKM